MNKKDLPPPNKFKLLMVCVLIVSGTCITADILLILAVLLGWVH